MVVKCIKMMDNTTKASYNKKLIAKFVEETKKERKKWKYFCLLLLLSSAVC